MYLNRPVLSTRQNEQFKEIQERRIQGEPLQYILGECEFMGITLKTDPRVLIPRPETELLVEKILNQMKNFSVGDEDLYGLDIGTGSGNIPIALLKHNPHWRMISIDISKDALDLAQENAVRNNVLSRIDFINCDVFNWLNERNAYLRQFSLIVSNPPYIKTASLADLPNDVRKEPQAALNGGDDGLLFYKHIIANAQYLLKPGGWLFFEIGETQGKSLENLLTWQGSFVNILTSQDFNQRDRIITAQFEG